MRRMASLFATVAIVLVVACGENEPPEERFFQIIQDEQSYLETLRPGTEDEQSAIERYSVNLSIFELGAEMSANVEWDVCQAGIPLERQKIADLRTDPRLAGSPLWDRYDALLDEVENVLCREYDDLTLVGDQYIGRLGDFRVNQGSVFDGKPCSSGIGEFGPFPFDYQESELWLDAFGPRAQPDFCTDDDTLSAIFKYTDRGIIKRGFFYQAPLAVHFNALREPPELLEIEGHPAILGREAPSSEQVFLYAIERIPEDGIPGIYVFVMGLDLDVDLALEIARDLLP